MENNKKIEICYSFGYVFDKSKLVVICPVGSNILDEEEFDIDVEVEFLRDGVQSAFSYDDIKDANKRIKPLVPFLGHYNDIVPLVSSIKDSETNEEMTYILKKFKSLYNVGEEFFKRGYSFKDIYVVCENINDYIPKSTDTSYLNILEIEKEKFDLEKLIEESNKLSKCKIVRKSKVLNHIFVDIKEENTSYDEIIKKLEQNDAIYATFAKLCDDEEKIICLDEKNIDLEIDLNDEVEESIFDFGQSDIDKDNYVGIVVELKDNKYTFKIASFDDSSDANQNIAQLIEDSGDFKEKINEFLKKYI